MKNGKRRVLAIGAHPDDVELGAGGFIKRLTGELAADVWFLVLTSGCPHGKLGELLDADQRRHEAKASARRLGVKGKKRVEVLDYEDCRMQNYTHDFIEEIEKRLYRKNGRRRFDMVLTHARGDTHSDHKQTHEATIAAARDFDGTILLYQSPSTIPNEFRPTFFVNLNDRVIRYKKKL